MTQQTAVDGLINQVEDFIGLIPVDIIEQAKQMEREQIINAQMDMFNHINGVDYGTDYLNKRDAAIKYAEDYSTRLQNETNSTPNKIPPLPTPPASRFLKEGKEPPKRNQLK